MARGNYAHRCFSPLQAFSRRKPVVVLAGLGAVGESSTPCPGWREGGGGGGRRGTTHHHHRFLPPDAKELRGVSGGWLLSLLP